MTDGDAVFFSATIFASGRGAAVNFQMELTDSGEGEGEGEGSGPRPGCAAEGLVGDSLNKKLGDLLVLLFAAATLVALSRRRFGVWN